MEESRGGAVEVHHLDVVEFLRMELPVVCICQLCRLVAARVAKRERSTSLRGSLPGAYASSACPMSLIPFTVLS